ncbi:hypothetical protein PIROE2DRAFT_1328 [Piromyces sp. E2]|nr:hypothetical protein PIROE2DRAFT_1328 [Piromyces sp. E2]|eukprot:OUM70465.1 hypothetical protein PIROE2DRAFT_1328 [Piromyces sp. E2]
MSNKFNSNSQTGYCINNKLSENDIDKDQQNNLSENSTENSKDKEQSITIDNNNTEFVIENDNQGLNEEKKKGKIVTFNVESELIGDDELITKDNTGLTLKSNDETKIDENLNSTFEINGNNITEENKEQKMSEYDLNDNKDEQNNDDLNKMVDNDEIIKNGKKRIILKLNEGNNTTTSDNNILELEVDQLNNREQIRFIIKIASNIQDQYIMKHGFISKYVFYSKYHIIHVDQHVRLPSHFTEGKVRASEIKSSLNLINIQRKRHLYTMAVLNNSNIVNIMDIDGSSNVNHVLTVKLKEKLTNYVLLEKIGHYAACTDNTFIEVNEGQILYIPYQIINE